MLAKINLAWQWAVRPADVLEAGQKLRARLLSQFIVAIILMGAAASVFAITSRSAEAQSDLGANVVWVMLGMVLCWYLSRTAHYRLAAMGVIFFIVLVMFKTVYDLREVHHFHYSLVGILLGSLFFSNWKMVLLLVGNVVIILVMAVGLPLLPASAAIDAVIYQAFMSSLVLAVMRYREQVERDSQQALAESREQFRALSQELEQRVAERTAELWAANAALHESQDRWRLLVENVPDVILTLDRELQILFMNHAIEDMDPQKVKGRKMSDYLPPKELAIVADAVQQAFEEGADSRIELPVMARGRDLRWFDCRLAPLRDNLGDVTAVLLVGADETGRRLAQEEIEKQNKELAVLNQAEQQARRLAETLQAANLALTETLELDAVLQTLLDFLSRLVAFDSANVMLRVDDHKMEVCAIRDCRDQPRNLLLTNRIFDINHFASLKKLVETQRSVLVADTFELPTWIHMDETAYIRSWLGVPLVAGGEVIGLYSLDKAEANYFDQNHRLAAEALAAQAAVAVQNALLFDQVKNGREQSRRLALQVVTAQEEERRRVSRELHDEAGQALTALKISLALALSRLSEAEGQTSLPPLQRDLQTAVAVCEGTMDQIRRLAYNLRPAALDDLGLNSALEGFSEDFADRTGLVIDYQGEEIHALPEAVSISLYRFLQEALTNVARHSRADTVSVQLACQESAVSLTITDNGVGFDQPVEGQAPPDHLGIGLIGMKERLQLLNGRLTIHSQPGQGTRLQVTIPRLDNV